MYNIVFSKESFDETRKFSTPPTIMQPEICHGITLPLLKSIFKKLNEQ